LVPFSLLLSHSLFPSSLALSLTHRYSPIVDDVNKRIKIQITPVRSDGVEGPTYQVTLSLSLSLSHSLTHPPTHSLTHSRARALSLSHHSTYWTRSNAHNAFKTMLAAASVKCRLRYVSVSVSVDVDVRVMA